MKCIKHEMQKAKEEQVGQKIRQVNQKTIKIIMSLSTRRYQESPKNQSAFVLSTRKSTASKQKLAPIGSSLILHNNPQHDIRLPSLSRSSMRKSFSTFQSDRNTKFKLQTLEEKLQQIKHHIHLLRQEAKETVDFTKVLRETLVDKELAGINKDMKQKIQGLHNFVKSTINQHRQRSNDLRDDCGALWDQNQQIKSLTFELRMKVEDIQKNMGYKH